MRWSCPHCGIALGISDQKMKPGWVFSRCYRCGGHALIQKGSSNLVKMDGIPPGENILLAEPHEDFVLSRTARKNFQQIVGNRPLPTPLPTQDHAMGAPALSSRKLIFLAIGVSGILSIFSGINLFLQGDILEIVSHQKQSIPETQPPKRVVSQRENLGLVYDSDSSKDHLPPPVRTDSLNLKAMAPQRVPSETEIQKDNPMVIKITTQNAALRTGPGLRFPKAGSAQKGSDYQVLSWKGDWFEVLPLDDQNPYRAKPLWVRNDSVTKYGP